MTNYSHVFAAVLEEYESPFVPGDRGDEGKGQVTARAGERIHRTLDPAVGFIAKNPGQTQYHGIAVDALQDKNDGFGADYLTDELQPDGRRLIKLAYTAYPTAAVPPTTGWVQPTQAHTEYGGPLVLKSAAPEPGPTPPPVTDDTAQQLAAINAKLDAAAAQQAADTAAILARSDANTEKIQTQIHDLVEDVEQTLIKLGIVYVLRKRREPPAV